MEKREKVEFCTKREALWTFATSLFLWTKPMSSSYLLCPPQVHPPPLVSVLCWVSWLILKHLQPTARSYWSFCALPHWVPMAPEVMLFVWGSGVVPISVKKALLSLIPTRTRMQGSSAQPQLGQPPPPDGALSSFCQKVNERTPKREGGPPAIMICMTVIVWPPWGGHGWLRWVCQGKEGQSG